MKQRLEKVCKEQKDVLEIKNMLMMGKKKHNKILEDKIEKSPCQQKKKYEEMENRIKGLKKKLKGQSRESNIQIIGIPRRDNRDMNYSNIEECEFPD